MSDLRIGSLCSGYGGLDEGVRSVLGGRTVWVSDVCKFTKAGGAQHHDPCRAPCTILAHRYPDVPNLGDFATDAHNPAGHGERSRPQPGQGGPTAGRLFPTPRTSDTNGPGLHGDGGIDLRTAVTLLPTPAAHEPGGTLADYHARLKAHDGRNSTFAPLSMAVQLLPTPRAGDGDKGGPNQAGSSGDLMLPSAVQPARWGQYAAAVAHWENVSGRSAPVPTMTSTKGTPQLAPRFVEWMMGLPAGWVTDVPGITRNEALKALGNGVVPQQAAAALRTMLAWEVAA